MAWPDPGLPRHQVSRSSANVCLCAESLKLAIFGLSAAYPGTGANRAWLGIQGSRTRSMGPKLHHRPRSFSS